VVVVVVVVVVTSTSNAEILSFVAQNQTGKRSSSLAQGQVLSVGSHSIMHTEKHPKNQHNRDC